MNRLQLCCILVDLIPNHCLPQQYSLKKEEYQISPFIKVINNTNYLIKFYLNFKWFIFNFFFINLGKII